MAMPLHTEIDSSQVVRQCQRGYAYEFLGEHGCLLIQRMDEVHGEEDADDCYVFLCWLCLPRMEKVFTDIVLNNNDRAMQDCWKLSVIPICPGLVAVRLDLHAA